MSIWFPSLFPTVDIQHAHDLSAVLRSHGIKVYPVSGDTPDDEERRFYRLFTEGAIDGLASCGVLNEGADFPRAMGCFLTRPLKSPLLYRQIVGRVLRPFPPPAGDRHYQTEAISAIGDHLRQGVLSQLLVMPTGTGKTWVAAHVPPVVEKLGGRKGRTLFLVHRDNLVTQAADAFRTWTKLSVGIEKGGGHYAGDADVVVGSVQSLGPAKSDTVDGATTWEYNKRLSAINPDHFTTVIVDEAHHAPKGIFYLNLLRYFGVLKGERTGDKLLLMITATPNRSDNVGMEALCDKIVYNYDLRTAIKDGYLADIHAFRCETWVDISQVHTTAGELNVPELSHAVNTPERNEIVAREYLKIREQIATDVQPGMKPYAVVADFVDVAGRHSLVTTPTLFGLREKFDAKGGSMVTQVEEIEQIEKEHPMLDLRTQPNLEAIKSSLHKLDLLAPPQTPPEIRAISGFTWLGEGEGAYRLSCMDGAMLSIRENSLGNFDVYRHVKGVRTKLYATHDLKEALAQAEKEIPAKDRMVLASEASWRREPPTEKQATRLFMRDKKMRQQFKKAADLYAFCKHRFDSGDTTYSRGGMSNRIDSQSQSLNSAASRN